MVSRKSPTTLSKFTTILTTKTSGVKLQNLRWLTACEGGVDAAGNDC